MILLVWKMRLALARVHWVHGRSLGLRTTWVGALEAATHPLECGENNPDLW